MLPGDYLSHHVGDGGRADDEAVLVLEENPCVNPRLQSEKKKRQSQSCCSGVFPPTLAHHGIQERERSQEEEGLSCLTPHRLIHMVEFVYDVVP